MAPLRIVADENIPCVRGAFGGLGSIELRPGREITAATVAKADILLVRSVTRVDGALLRDSRVRFVATATIGTDHVDLRELERLGIGFAAAPGSNANSVAEYVVAALLALAVRTGRELRGLRLGIVGVGNVGRRVATLAGALGMDLILNDPPRARAEGAGAFAPLGVLLGEADVVTLHVPLVDEGRDRTRHLVDRGFIEAIRPGAWLVNTARGAVADSRALLEGRRTGRLGALVCDVWEEEPRPSPELVGIADLATPHVAGYSTDGKFLGVRMIHEALCRYLGVDASWDPDDRLPIPAHPRIEWAGGDSQAGYARAVAHGYDIRRDDDALRRAIRGAGGDPGPAFDRLRREYPVRREFRAYEVVGTLPDEVRAAIRGLGFRVAPVALAEDPAGR